MMTRAERDHELLAKQRHQMKTVVFRLRQAIDRRLEFGADQFFVELLRGAVDELQLDVRMLVLQGGNQADQVARADGAHDAELKRCALQRGHGGGRSLGLLGLADHLLHIGPHGPAQLGQLGAAMLAVKQPAAQLVFQLLDGAGQ